MPRGREESWVVEDRSFVQQLKERLTKVLVDEFDVPATGRRDAGPAGALLEQRLRGLLDASMAQDRRLVGLSAADQQQLIIEIVNDFSGFGPIAPFMEDPEVGEIMINGPRRIYVERAGKLQRTDAQFRDEEHLRQCLERLLDPIGHSVTESEPYLDAALPDGSRLNVIIPPLCLNGPTVTIRKHLQAFSLEDLERLGTMTPALSAFLVACIRARVNMVISGGTSTGKTTLVTALSRFMSEDERIITIENAAELQLVGHDHWIRLVARPGNVEGRGEVPVRQLVKNALRMRPDRIILGEARGGEAFDMIQAMNTGHDGIITVLHANGPADALERLEMLMLMSGVDLPPAACRTQVGRVIDLIVHFGRFADGSRKVTQVSQIVQTDAGGSVIEDVFAFTVQGVASDGRVEGRLRATGKTPRFLHKFTAHGLTVQPEWFT